MVQTSYGLYVAGAVGFVNPRQPSSYRKWTKRIAMDTTYSSGGHFVCHITNISSNQIIFYTWNPVRVSGSLPTKHISHISSTERARKSGERGTFAIPTIVTMATGDTSIRYISQYVVLLTYKWLYLVKCLICSSLYNILRKENFKAYVFYYQQKRVYQNVPLQSHTNFSISFANGDHVFISVCLSVCEQIHSKSCELFGLKFLWMIDNNTRMDEFNTLIPNLL